MKVLSLFIFSFVVSNSFAQCKIKNVYADLFTVKKQVFNDKIFILKQVNLVDKSVCYSDLINKNNSHIDYLLINFSDHSKNDELSSIESDDERTNVFLNNLKKDSLFTAVINKLVAKTMDVDFVCDTFTVDEMMDVAVKFFSITGLSQDGYYQGKVCVGINGLSKTQNIRKPHLEAFCFSSILANYNSKRYGMYDEFVEGIKTLYKLNLGVTDDERVLRAQGALYMFMLYNKPLKAMLLEEYEKKKDYLPFVIAK